MLNAYYLVYVNFKKHINNLFVLVKEKFPATSAFCLKQYILYLQEEKMLTTVRNLTRWDN